MAQQYVAPNNSVLVDPGTYVEVTVRNDQAGIPSAGVVTLIGEANEGPHHSEEADLTNSAFTPDQLSSVIQKYGSGRLVDAFRSIVAAANDPAITGSVSLVRMVKTNLSSKASLVDSRNGFGTYATYSARRAGVPGNLIRMQHIVAQAETAPTSGAFTYAPALTGSTTFKIRNNGGAPKSITVAAKQAPDALTAAMHDIALGILARGGAEKLVIPSAGLALTATAPSASVLQVSLPVASLWANSPAVGDTAVIPLNGDYSAAQDSEIDGTASANAASYIVTAVTNSATNAQITLKRISSGTCVSASGTSSADLRDMVLYSPIEIKNATGQDRGSLVGVDGTYNCTSNDTVNAIIQLPSGKVFAADPKAGDLVKLASNFAGVTAGIYQVVDADEDTIEISRLSDGSAGTTGSAVVASPPTLSTQPFVVEKAEIDGLGKSLAIEGSVDSLFRDSATTSGAGLNNAFKVSATELKMQTQVTKDGQTESYTSSGEIAIQIGCTAADATIEILADKIDFKENGVLKFSAPYSQFKTLADLASFINSKTKWSASIPVAKLQLVAPSSLDKGIFTVTGLTAVRPGRIKRDAEDHRAKLAQSAQISLVMSEDAGLPQPMSSAQFLSGGDKGGTTSAASVAAIDAVEDLETNFIVPLFSQDASLDIALGETESSSTYAVDAINAYCKSHVLEMSQYKRKKNRLAICSKKGTFLEAKEAAGQLASSRVALCFQDIKLVAGDGLIKQFQPFMAAVITAGMQAAAGYKGLVKKIANISGALQAAGDFNSANPGQREDALTSGLLFIEKIPTGGFRFASDQMTYSVDSNFVYNSLQANYVADLMVLTLIERFDRSVVGKSVAEITAAGGLAILEAEMFNFLRLRWIAPSDDAPRGYKNASAKLTGGVLSLSVEAKIAGLIYFVPISLTLSQVTQEASQQ